MFQTLRNAWKIPDLRKRMLYTLVMIVIFRLGTFIPVPGLNASVLQSLVEGGQMPIYRRLPKRGFTNIFAKQYAEVKITDLNKFEDGAVVDAQALVEAGIIKKTLDGVKVLGNGNVEKKVTVKAAKFTETAKEKIEAAGGKVEVM